MLWRTLVIIWTSRCILAMSPHMIDLLTPLRELGEGCAYDNCPTPRPGMLNVHIVPHTHYELGDTRNFYQHYSGATNGDIKIQINMKKTLDAVITELWGNRNRRFTLSDFPYFFYWWSTRDSTVRRMVFELVRQGRLHFVGGGWSMNDEATTSYHAIIESFTYSLRKLNATFLSCGRPLVAWQADVMGHSREFANLAAMMGFDGLFINPISFDDELERMSRWALEFLWRGSDDIGPLSDIYTHKLFDGVSAPPGFCFSAICKDPLIVTENLLFSNVKERVEAFKNSMFVRQASNYNTSHVMVIMGKPYTYHDANLWFANMDKLIDEVNHVHAKKSGRMFMAYSTPACFSKSVHGEKAKLETKQDDFFPHAVDESSYASGLYTTYPPMKLMAREALVYFQMIKQMQVLAKLPYYSRLYEDFNWILAAFQDHKIITGVMTKSVKSFYTHKMYVAMQKSTLLLKEAWNKIRKSPTSTIYYRCSLNVSSCHTSLSSFYFIMVYNPLSWSVTMPVRIPVMPNGDIRVYLPNGETARSFVMRISDHIADLKQRHRTSRHEVVFLAEKLPPLGFRSYFIEKHATRRTRSLIKNSKWKHKKFLMRQTNTVIPDRALLNDLVDYEYYDTTDNTTDDVSVTEQTNFDDENNLTMTELTKTDVTESNLNTSVESEPTITELVKRKWANTKSNPEAIESTTKDDLNLLDASRKRLWKEYARRIKNKDQVKVSDTEKEDLYEAKLLSNDNDYAYDTEDASSTARSTDLSDYIEETTGSSTETPKNMTEDEKEGEKQEKELDEEKVVKEENGIKEDNEKETKADKEQDDENEIEVEYKDEDIKEEMEKKEKEGEKIDEKDKTRDEEKIEADDEEIKVEEEEEKREEADKIKEIDELTEESGRRSMDYYFNYDPYRSDELFIENKYIRVNLDPSSHKIADVTLSNGVQATLDVQFYFYISDDPVRLKRPNIKQPGAFIFRAMDVTPVPILDFMKVKVYKNDLVQEAHFKYADGASFVARIYADTAVIEIDWVVGPVPLYDSIGKEVFIRYKTDLANKGVFYTDSNGRQTIKRIRNTRPMFTKRNPDDIAGNFYPVTSKIYIEDEQRNARFSVFNDRSQGGTSLYDGEIDLMLQRSVLTDDSGIGAIANETEFGEGIVVRGKHYLYLSKASFKPHKVFEKKFAKELELQPQILFSPPDPYQDFSKKLWLEHVNEVSFMHKKLPVGIHVLTLESWNDGTLLLRLENYLETHDIKKSGKKKIFIDNLFANILIKSAKETTLAANIWLKDFVKKKWPKREDFVKNFNDFYGTSRKVEFLKDENFTVYDNVDLNEGIVLSPQEIRTFVCVFEYTR